jgi:predicted nucleic acid-binding protein
MAFVIDASIVLAWLLPDEQSGAAERLIGRAARERARAPSLLLLEVGNALLQAERRNRLPAALRSELLDAFTSLPIALEPVGAESMLRANDVAGRHALSLYDACYLELALARGLPLATLDRALARAARGEQMPVLPEG